MIDDPFFRSLGLQPANIVDFNQDRIRLDFDDRRGGEVHHWQFRIQLINEEISIEVLKNIVEEIGKSIEVYYINVEEKRYLERIKEKL